MSLRDERAAAIRRHYRQLADSLTEALPALLDELENIDEAHGPEPFLTMGGRKVELTPEQEERIRAALDAAKDGPHVPFPAEDPQAAPAEHTAPAKPAPRRRTRT